MSEQPKEPQKEEKKENHESEEEQVHEHLEPNEVAELEKERFQIYRTFLTHFVFAEIFQLKN
jgi:hypothetical protein